MATRQNETLRIEPQRLQTWSVGIFAPGCVETPKHWPIEPSRDRCGKSRNGPTEYLVHSPARQATIGQMAIDLRYTKRHRVFRHLSGALQTRDLSA
jgi:hypothetical protein